MESSANGSKQSLVWPEGHEIEAELYSIRLLEINRMSGLRMTVDCCHFVVMANNKIYNAFVQST